MVVRGHPCMMELAGGATFTVDSFLQPINGGWTCNICGRRNAGPNEMAAEGLVLANGKHPRIPISWLMKITPPSLDADTSQNEELVEVR